MSQLSQPVTKDFGPTPEKVTVTSVIDHQGIAITTIAGGGYNSTLSRTFPHAEVDAARVFYGHIKDCAKAGKAVHQIEAEVSALIDASRAVDVEAVAEAINADVNAAQAARVAEHTRVVQVVAEVMADADPNWRRKVREQARQDAPRRIHPTRTNVHCKPLTAVELDLIRNHQDGVVTTRPGQSWTVLRAIERRGYGEPAYRPGTRIIASITLNQRGLAVAQQNGVAA